MVRVNQKGDVLTRLRKQIEDHEWAYQQMRRTFGTGSKVRKVINVLKDAEREIVRLRATPSQTDE